MADAYTFDEYHRHLPTRQGRRSRPVLAGLLLLALTDVQAASSGDIPPLNWYPRSMLPPEQQTALPDYCSGDYQPSRIEAFADHRLEAEADRTRIEKNGDAILEGDVSMQRGSYLLNSDAARWDKSLHTAWFDGDVRLNSPDVVVESLSAHFQETGPQPGDGTLTLEDAEYALPDRHMRGSADTMITTSTGQVSLRGATMTYCEPGQNDWELAASQINLDQERGVGSAWHTRLRVRNVPVLYIPYYRFPIDDQRTTGFLDPVFSINGSGSLAELKAPFYLNIAANADATITPHYLDGHGWIWENQFRHKTALLGDGELNYNYLDQDASTDQSRWLLNYSQRGTFGEHWSHRSQFNKISDNRYLSDLNSSVGIDRTTHMPRRAVLSWADDNGNMDLTAEGFQTIDDNISLADRPYQRLPDLRLGYQNRHNGWWSGHELQASAFKRDHEAIIDGNHERLTGFDALDGNRLVADNGIWYRFENSWGYLMPGAEYRYRRYSLFSEADLTDTEHGSINIGAPRYSLDSGITLERDTRLFAIDMRQTLEPRLFWVRSPAPADQEFIPAFDTRRTTVSYDSLFQGDRFTGKDRLADLNQLSLGVTTRLLTVEGDEWLKFSIGRVNYFADRQVQLTRDELQEDNATSSTLTETEWYPRRNWSVYQMLEWDAYHNYARQRRFGISYHRNGNQLFNLASHKVQALAADTGNPEIELYQADINSFWSINDSWAVTGRMLRDLKGYNADERRPLSPWLETLAGFEYQNCCWRFQLLYRSLSPTADDDSAYSTNLRHSLMFSVQLKGLGTFGGGTDSTIGQSIKGYSRRQYHDY